MIIGNFISTVLVEGRGDFGRWIDQKCNENQGKILLELFRFISSTRLDEENLYTSFDSYAFGRYCIANK